MEPSAPYWSSANHRNPTLGMGLYSRANMDIRRTSKGYSIESEDLLSSSNLPEQRDYILFYAIPGSAVVRNEVFWLDELS